MASCKNDFLCTLLQLQTRINTFSSGFSIRPAAGEICQLFHVNSPPSFLGNNSQKSQNLMLSMFCSNTLIFAPECWKCTLRYPYFKIFPGVMPPDFPSNLRFWHLQVAPWVLSGTILSFLYRRLQSFCHLLKTLLKTPFHTFNHLSSNCTILYPPC